MPRIIDELKILLSLEDKATAQLKEKAKGINKQFSAIKSMVVGGVLAALAGFLINASSEFQKLSNQMQEASFRFKTTEKNVRNLNFQLIEMAKDSTYSTEELAKGLTSISEAGLSATSSMMFLQSALDLSKKTGVDLNDIIEFQTTLMKNKYVKSGEEAEEITNALSNVSQELGVNFDVLAAAFLKNADAAMKADVTFDDLIKLLATDIAGLGVNQGLELLELQMRALAGEKDAIGLLSQLPEGLKVLPGMQVDEVIGNMLGYVADLDLPTVRGELEKIQTAMQISGQTNLADILERFANIPPEDLKKMIHIGVVTDLTKEPEGKTEVRSTLTDILGGALQELNVRFGALLDEFIFKPQREAETQLEKFYAKHPGSKERMKELYATPGSKFWDELMGKTEDLVEKKEEEKTKVDEVNKKFEELKGRTKETTDEIAKAPNLLRDYNVTLAGLTRENIALVDEARKAASEAKAAAKSMNLMDRILRDRYRTKVR